MFDFDEAVHTLDKLESMNPGKRKRKVVGIISSEDFLKWVYTPDDGQPVSARQFTELQSYLLTSKNLRAIADGLLDVDYAVDRSVATFLNALCGSAVEAYNKQSEMLAEERKKNTISGKNIKALEEKLETYRGDIEYLAKAAKRVVRRQVRNLSKQTRLDKKICRLGYWYVPGPKYLTRNRIGVFLRELLSAIYDQVAEDGFMDSYRGPDWKAYFTEIFGRNNTPSVATFILLEGVNSVNRYKGTPSMTPVRECWDSLTDYALHELNDAPDEMRNQMIELYLKRIDRQFRNKRTDLRVDLRNLPSQFKDLIKTVSKYTDRINNILDRAKESANTRTSEA